MKRKLCDNAVTVDLPWELWPLIMAYLPLVLRWPFLTVNSRFIAIVYDSVLEIDSRTARQLNDRHVTRMRNLQSLDTRRAKFLTMAVLINRPSLRKLVLPRRHHHNTNVFGDYTTMPSMTQLSSLRLGYSKNTTEWLGTMTSLRSLSLTDSVDLTDQSLSRLTNLVHLNLGVNSHLSDRGIIGLSGLQSLVFKGCVNITHLCFASFTSLTRLEVTYHSLGDAALTQLVNLKELRLALVRNVTVDGIRVLTALTSLSLYATHLSFTQDTEFLSRLQYLAYSPGRIRGRRAIETVGYVNVFRRKTYQHLTSLTCLSVEGMHSLNDDTLGLLTKLKSLCMTRPYHNVSVGGLCRLTTLTHLVLNQCPHFTTDLFTPLTSLVHLRVLDMVDNVQTSPLWEAFGDAYESRLIL